MRKKSVTRTSRSHHPPLFYVFFGVATFFTGIIVAVITTTVLAQTTNNTIYACINKNTGFMRSVDANETCRQGEDSLSWNIQGPPGPTGVPGQSSSNGLPFTCASPCYMTPYADKFRGKDFSGAQMFQANFNDADLTGVIFKGGLIGSVRFNNTNLTGADFSDIRDIPGWFGISNNRFVGANLTNANFSNSSFSGSDFTNTNLQNVNFSNTTLRFGSFAGAQNMETANITGTTWVSVTCPDGTNSDDNGNTCIGHF